MSAVNPEPEEEVFSHGWADPHSMTVFADGLACNDLRRWRWFIDGPWILFEPPGRDEIRLAEMEVLKKHVRVERVAAVFRSTPHPGIYLRFRLRSAA